MLLSVGPPKMLLPQRLSRSARPRTGCHSPWLVGIASIDPDAAIRAIQSRPSREQVNQVADIARLPACQAFVERWLEVSASDPAFPMRGDNARELSLASILETLGFNSVHKPTQELQTWLDRFAGRPFAAPDSQRWLPSVLTRPDSPLDSALQWLTSFSLRDPSTAQGTFREVFRITKDHPAAERWLNSNRHHPLYDFAVLGFLSNASQTSAASASDLLSRITAPSLQEEAAALLETRSQ
jgi:hypothetical protein